MKIITFIGDVHAKFTEYLDILGKIDNPTIQVGDFGLGFHPEIDKSLILNPKDKFFRGNHDDPAVCKSFTNNCMSDYGYDPKTKIFHLAGAFSVDKDIRIERKWEWWHDEEISKFEHGNILTLFEETKPEIVVTHTIPDAMMHHLTIERLKAIRSDTGQLLDKFLEIHKPKKWIFGHMHQSIRKNVLGIEWVGLDELETYELEV